MKTLMHLSRNTSVIIALLLVFCLCSCGQVERAEQKAVVEQSTPEGIPQKKLIDFGPKIEAIITQNSTSGFASANQEQQKGILVIAQAVKANEFAAASKQAKQFVDQYGQQTEVQTIMDISKPYLPQTAVWKGGTPGKPNAWEEPRNWSTNAIPDEDSYVIIPAGNTGYQAQPVIQTAVQVTAIEIQSGATLSIRSNGDVLVDGTYGYSEGIQIHGGHLVNEGEITLKNIDQVFIASLNPKQQESKFSFYSEDYDFAFVSITDGE